MRRFLALMLVLAAAPLCAFAQPAGQTDETLMTWYGAKLRQAFRGGDADQVSTDEFLAVEAELERRRLIDRETVGEIERGVVYAASASRRISPTTIGTRRTTSSASAATGSSKRRATWPTAGSTAGRSSRTIRVSS